MNVQPHPEVIRVVQEWKDSGHKIYMTSGGFDPLHVGHLRCLQHTAELAEKNNGKVVVLVNGDQFLVEKKGKPFMNAKERLEIVAGIGGVDLAVEWYDGTQTVIGAIELFKPNYFTKGGDRNDPEMIPEWDTCEKVGCGIILGVGGEKVQSSSSLIENAGTAEE
jgi:cytidyltransferase-like protein